MKKTGFHHKKCLNVPSLAISSFNLHVPFEPAAFSLHTGCHLFFPGKSTLRCSRRPLGPPQWWARLETLTRIDPMGAWEGSWQRSGTVQQQSQEAAVMGEGPSCSEMGMLVTLGGLCGPFNRHIARSCCFLHYGLLVSRKSCPELYRNARI